MKCPHCESIRSEVLTVTDSNEMKCPKCGYGDSCVAVSGLMSSFQTSLGVIKKVISKQNRIRRRRQCLSCHHRYTTYEIIKEKLYEVIHESLIK